MQSKPSSLGPTLGGIALCSLLSSPFAIAHTASPERLGRVHFETSCSATAQQSFDTAMLYQHSFWYREATQHFERTLAADPDCAIAWWGIALSLLLNPHIAPPAANVARGAEAIAKARATGKPTAREREYIESLGAFYAGFATVAHKDRVERYLAAQKALAARYPDDDEAQIAYAITLNVAASPNDKTYARQLEGAAILEPIFVRQPHHPGVAHYLIHLYDYPPIAHKGLDAAKRYAEIAPDAPHALHMPSHIFTRVGYWKESVASNAASAKAARENNEPHDQMHAMDYMVYAHLQLAQDDDARAVIDQMSRVSGYGASVRTAPYAKAASRARYVIERHDWPAAAALTVEPTQFAYVDAITHFARGLGRARVGDIEGARSDRDRLSALAATLRDKRDAYWAEQVDIQRQVVDSMILAAEDRHADALAALGKAADIEDATEKSIVTPGPLVPARELYAAMLLQQRRADDALAQFQKVLEREPNRFNALAGAAEAARAAGRTEVAEASYRKMLASAAERATARPELVAARSWLAAH